MDMRKPGGRGGAGGARRAVPLLVLLTLSTLTLTAGSAQAADDPMQKVSRLFGSAAYEDTLAAIARLDDPALLDQAGEYRALCLLALNRDDEAERAVELMVLRNPIPSPGLQGRAPKFDAMYRGVRRRLVPRLANGAYNAARDSFSAKDYAAAKRQFDETLELVRSAEDPAELRDLELLATGFRTLAEARLEAAKLPRIPELPFTPVLAETALEPPPPILSLAPVPVSIRPAPFAPVARVYGADDRDVTPPLVIDQRLPVWMPPSGVFLRRSFTGQLRIVVGDDGRVASAEIIQPSFGPYDELLLKTVRLWRYQPAIKGGRSVQYRRVVEYVLNVPGQSNASR